MKSLWILILGVLALSAPSRANTAVELVGRVTGTNLTTGPWSGVRAGEYLVMTYQVEDNGTIVPPNVSLCGFGMRRFAVIPGTLHVTVHGVTMDAPFVAG